MRNFAISLTLSLFPPGPFQDDRKMFIGGLSWETTVDEMKEYFAKYGDVKDAGTCPLTLMALTEW